MGDRARRVLHDAASIRTGCLREGLDVRDLVDVHSDQMRDFLLRSERWQACPRCLPPGR